MSFFKDIFSIDFSMQNLHIIRSKKSIFFQKVKTYSKLVTERLFEMYYDN